MVYFGKKSAWFWIGIGLTIINISLLGTLGFKYSNIKPQEPAPEVNERIVNFMSRELGFDANQHEQLKESRISFVKESSEYRDKLREIQNEFFQELSSSEPDHSKLDSLSKIFGEHQGSLKSVTWRHFLDVKSLCTLEQAQKLDIIYKNMNRPNKYFKNKRRHQRGKGRRMRQQQGRERQNR